MNGSHPAALVSVIIPTRNRPEALTEAIASVRAQTYRPVEVVVVDDASDQVLALPPGDDPDFSLRVMRTDSPRGGGFCRDFGARHAAGEYLCFLDDDDIYYDNKLTTLVSALAAEPAWDAVFGRVAVSTNGTLSVLDYGLADGSELSTLKQVCSLQTNGSLLRRGTYGKACFAPLQKYQDTQFHVELFKRCRVGFVNSVVAEWRKNYSSEQMTAVKTRSAREVSIARFLALIDYFREKALLGPGELRFFERKAVRYYAEFSLYEAGLAYVGRTGLALLPDFIIAFFYYRLPGFFALRQWFLRDRKGEA